MTEPCKIQEKTQTEWKWMNWRILSNFFKKKLNIKVNTTINYLTISLNKFNYVSIVGHWDLKLNNFLHTTTKTNIKNLAKIKNSINFCKRTIPQPYKIIYHENNIFIKETKWTAKMGNYAQKFVWELVEPIPGNRLLKTLRRKIVL